jgi:signal transduction histidine kinase
MHSLSIKQLLNPLKENPIVRNTSRKDVYIALYGTIAFLLCTIIVFRFGKAQHQPLSTFLLIALVGSCGVFLGSILLNLPRPDKLRVFGLVSLVVFYVTIELFLMWYSHDDKYSIFGWNGLVVTVLYTVTNLDRTFDPKRVKEIEHALYYGIIVGMIFYGFWMLLLGYLWLIDDPVFQQEIMQNAILATYLGLGAFWIYWEIVSLRIRERITRETMFFLRKHNQKSIASVLSKTRVAELKRGHQLSIQVIQVIKKIIREIPSAKFEGVIVLENWRQHFGRTLEAIPDRTLLTTILSTYSEISARPQLRAVLNDDQASIYERMIAFRELTELSLDEKGTVDPFEYLSPSGDINTDDIYDRLNGLIKMCLKNNEPRRYIGALHQLDSLLYQYLHDGIKHIVASQLENQLESGDFQKSEEDLKRMVELSRNIFGHLDELLDMPLFERNLEHLERYTSLAELMIEDRVRLSVVYARKVAKKVRFLRGLIRKQQVCNLHQIINTVIEQKRDRDIKIITEFAHSHPKISSEADVAFDIICENNLIHQALINLVDNAITAMANSKVKQLTFSTELKAAEIVVKIKDTGCGIPAARQARLFLEGSGLKIARSNIEIHGGSLELETSAVGKGSIFVARLSRKLPDMR